MRKILIEKENADPKTCSFGFPWKHDSICYNFNMPDECVSADNVAEITAPENIGTLVIGCDLTDYSFIASMTNLNQLYIYSSANITSLDFVKKLNKLRQLYITDSHIASLDPLVELIKERKRAFDAETDVSKRLFMMIDGICINSDKELDGKVLKEPGFYITEIIVNHKRVAG